MAFIYGLLYRACSEYLPCRLTRFSVSYDHIHCVPRRISRPSGHCGPPLPGSWSWPIDPVADQREANGQNIQVSDNVRNCVRVIIDASSSTPFPLCFVGVCVLLFDFFFFDGASSSSDNRLGLLSVERLRLSTPARIRILRCWSCQKCCTSRTCLYGLNHSQPLC